MIESMAGKSACLHGLCHDCTPFTFSEEQPAVEYFAELLVKGWLLMMRISPLDHCIYCYLHSWLQLLWQRKNV